MDEIKDLVKGVFEKITSQRADQQKQLENLWQKVLDEKALKHTKLAGIKDGKILAYVDSPAWLYEMNLRKNGLLNKLKSEISPLEAIYFKLGKIK